MPIVGEPYKEPESPIGQLLGLVLKGGQYLAQGKQDKAYRSSAAKILGVDEADLGHFQRDELSKLVQEKMKSNFTNETKKRTNRPKNIIAMMAGEESPENVLTEEEISKYNPDKQVTSVLGEPVLESQTIQGQPDRTNQIPQIFRDLAGVTEKEARRKYLGLSEKKPSWGQSQEIASVKAGLNRGTGTVIKEFGALEEMPVKTLADAMKVIQFNQLDPVNFKEELKLYEPVKVINKEGQEGTIIRLQLEDAIAEGYTEVK